ncbi:hypothetical protein PIB30_078900 [Stylosanthes scabra]|uniref:Uncharacterized protein n=1 Tax=Stylosanthes scabra TaxID=79078 RepID=A0ABU6UQF2_9FABA|nr:hypothetical protein [Stylosanthes scabra]
MDSEIDFMDIDVDGTGIPLPQESLTGKLKSSNDQNAEEISSLRTKLNQKHQELENFKDEFHKILHCVSYRAANCKRQQRKAEIEAMELKKQLAHLKNVNKKKKMHKLA